MNRRTFSVTSHSLDCTAALGRSIGEVLQPGDCIALIGELGAGKTELVKGIAVGAGVPKNVPVNSPTFVLVNEYAGRVYIYHVDAYRLTGAPELAAVGFAEMLESGGVVLLEWADRVPSLLPPNALTIRMEHAGATSRRMTFEAADETCSRLLDAVARFSCET